MTMRLMPLVALVAAVILPLVLPNEYYLQILTQGYVFAIPACGLNVILRACDGVEMIPVG